MGNESFIGDGGIMLITLILVLLITFVVGLYIFKIIRYCIFKIKYGSLYNKNTRHLHRKLSDFEQYEYNKSHTTSI